MRVIGTAGHVDHGKSTLVEALTGYHPDRLREEREREMTIVLGFAWMTLPSGEEVGIVDVPGHRDFIENMLSGIGGIDAVLFVVAADEGVMPQTKEHLAILDLLQIQDGIIALTKTDLVDDPEWLDLVEADIRKEVSGTVLQDAPIVRVSAKSRSGVDSLKDALDVLLSKHPNRRDFGRPRLSVDRVFSLAGFGTIVTGTLQDGVFRVGDKISILPAGIDGRIRGLQTHKTDESFAVPGSRTAINISGISVAEIHRGDVVTHPGDYRPTRRLDVHFRLVDDVQAPLAHNMSVKLFLGASETLARVRLLGKEKLLPGDDGWLQLEPENPVVAFRGDRYILRRPSPGETLGGGVIVDPYADRRYKRFDKTVLERLQAYLKGDPGDLVMLALAANELLSIREISDKTEMSVGQVTALVEKQLENGNVIAFGENLTDPETRLMLQAKWTEMKEWLQKSLRTYHQENPLRKGMLKEELKSRLHSSQKAFNLFLQKLVEDGVLVENGKYLALEGFQVALTAKDKALADALLQRFRKAPFSPPTVKDCRSAIGNDLFAALIEQDVFIKVSDDVVFEQEVYQRMKQDVKSLIEKNGRITVAEMRDYFGTSRRYALAFLEHLDSLGFTKRVGDVRKLGRNSQG